MAWSDDEIIEEEENAGQYPFTDIPEDDEIPPDPDWEDSEDEAQNERKKLKRDLEAEALKRLEDAARSEEDFRNVIAWWDRLDANRERRERYHEISRSGDGIPLEFGESEASSLFSGNISRVLMCQVQKGDFIETIFFHPEDLHELVTEEYMCRSMKELKPEQKEMMFQKAILRYTTVEIGEIRGQTDRNIRKVWNTLLKKLRKEALNGLRFKLELGLPFTLEEKAFWVENESAAP